MRGPANRLQQFVKRNAEQEVGVGGVVLDPQGGERCFGCEFCSGVVENFCIWFAAQNPENHWVFCWQLDTCPEWRYCLKIRGELVGDNG